MSATAITQAPAQSRRDSLFVGLGVQLIVTFIVLYGVIFGASYYWFYTFSTDVAMDRLKEDLDTLLQAAGPNRCRSVPGDGARVEKATRAIIPIRII
jgi:hypothetical protein